MKLPSLMFESLFQDHFFGGDSGLPFLWQVIYHEATRANHLLFDVEDVQKFSEDQSRFAIPHDDPSSDKISDLMMDLFSLSELDLIKGKIKTLNYRERKQIFSVYLRFIDCWRYQLKQSLN